MAKEHGLKLLRASLGLRVIAKKLGRTIGDRRGLHLFDFDIGRLIAKAAKAFVIPHVVDQKWPGSFF